MPSSASAIVGATDPGRVLLIDDDPAILHSYGKALRRAGFHVETSTEADRAGEIIARQAYDVVVTDISMPGSDGFHVLEATRAVDPNIPVLLMTGGPALETAVRAVERGAWRYLMKPVLPEALEKAVTEALQTRRVARLKQLAFELYGQVEDGDAENTEKFERALELLWMAFQPILTWSKRSVFGYEALVRSDEISLARPDEFVRRAEELGRLHDLGRMIRKQIATVAASVEPAALFVNLHPSDLWDDGLFSPDAPLTAIADRVFLEITERASLSGIAEVRRRIADLRKLGFRIAVDDLGAGYSGLNTFAQLHPDLVKLDQSLVRGVDGDPTKQKLIQSMVQLCSELGILVIAEGIETVAERDALIRVGCDLLQGYLFARPARGFPEVAW